MTNYKLRVMGTIWCDTQVHALSEWQNRESASPFKIPFNNLHLPVHEHIDRDGLIAYIHVATDVTSSCCTLTCKSCAKSRLMRLHNYMKKVQWKQRITIQISISS